MLMVQKAAFTLTDLQY